MGGVTQQIDVAARLGNPSLSLAGIAKISEAMAAPMDAWNLELASYWPVDTGLSKRGWLSVFQWPKWSLW